MKTIALNVFALFLISSATALPDEKGCYRKSNNPKLRSNYSNLKAVKIPDNFDWGNVNGSSYLTNVKNQHIPQYCGSCWAQGAASSLSDRIKIMRKGAWPDINIAPQVFVSCVQTNETHGCDGGDPAEAYEWMSKNEGTDETCSIYRARGYTNGLSCSPITICRDCHSHSPCFVPDKYPIYKVKQYGTLKNNEADIQ